MSNMNALRVEQIGLRRAIGTSPGLCAGTTSAAPPSEISLGRRACPRGRGCAICEQRSGGPGRLFRRARDLLDQLPELRSDARQLLLVHARQALEDPIALRRETQVDLSLVER